MESQSHAKSPDNYGFPVSDIPNELIDEEVRRIRELSLKSLSANSFQLPSASCFTLQNYGHLCTTASFSPNFSLLCAGTSNSYIDVWSCTGNLLRSLKPSTELAAEDLNGICSIDDILEEKGTHMKRLIGHSGAISSSTFNRDGTAILSSSFDTNLRLWSTLTYSPLAVYSSHAFPVWDSDISPLGHYFISGSADRTARLWNFDYSYPLRIFAGHLSDVDCVKFHPNGCYFATGSSDKSCRIWDVSSGNCVRLFQGLHRSVSAMAFSRQGKHLCVGDLTGNLYVYDISEGKLLWNSEKNTSSRSTVLSVDFSNDGRQMAVSYSDSKLKIFSCDDFGQKPGEFYTKQTPIYTARYNHRDILMCAGPFCPE